MQRETDLMAFWRVIDTELARNGMPGLNFGQIRELLEKTKTEAAKLSRETVRKVA